MTRCRALGALTVGGKEVAAFQCEGEEGHAPFAPHYYDITWRDVDAPELPDAALFDPDEHFDNVVPFPGT